MQSWLCVVIQCYWSVSLASSVDSPPGHRFDHRNFISCTYAPTVCTWNVRAVWHIFFKWRPVSFILKLPLLPICLIIAPLCITQMYTAKYAEIIRLLCIMFSNLWAFISVWHTCDFLILCELHMNPHLFEICVTLIFYIIQTLTLHLLAKWAQVHMDLLLFGNVWNHISFLEYPFWRMLWFLKGLQCLLQMSNYTSGQPVLKHAAVTQKCGSLLPGNTMGF